MTFRDIRPREDHPTMKPPNSTRPFIPWENPADFPGYKAGRTTRRRVRAKTRTAFTAQHQHLDTQLLDALHKDADPPVPHPSLP